MGTKAFPVIDMKATGENITRLRRERGLTVREVQAYFGFEEPQAIYKWQKGRSLPTVDNLYALSALLEVPMEDILISSECNHKIVNAGQQAGACCPVHFLRENLPAVSAGDYLPALSNTASVRKVTANFADPVHIGALRRSAA